LIFDVLSKVFFHKKIIQMKKIIVLLCFLVLIAQGKAQDVYMNLAMSKPIDTKYIGIDFSTGVQYPTIFGKKFYGFNGLSIMTLENSGPAYLGIIGGAGFPKDNDLQCELEVGFLHRMQSPTFTVKGVYPLNNYLATGSIKISYKNLYLQFMKADFPTFSFGVTGIVGDLRKKGIPCPQ